MADFPNKKNNFSTLFQLFSHLSANQTEQLIRYTRLVQEHQKISQLVSRSDGHRLVENHLLPSLIATKIIDIPQGVTMIDIGSGAGLPAIPIKIIRPDVQYVLIESSRKKALFLKKSVALLNLSGIQVLNFRLGSDPPPRNINCNFFIVTARAVTSLENLFHLSQPLLVEGGFMLFWKGEKDITDLYLTAKKFHFSYQVWDPPLKYQQYSQKIKTMKLFQIFV